MEQVLLDIQRAYPELHIAYHQSNHEGDLIDWVQEYGRLAIGKGQEVDGVVLNAGGYTHTSIALRDAVACSRVPVVEVHVSDIMQREPFRQISLLTDVCAHSVIGQGTDGYRQAVEWILNRTTQHTDE
jgi:3-dehydroquinate dehydratase-2